MLMVIYGDLWLLMDDDDSSLLLLLLLTLLLILFYQCWNQYHCAYCGDEFPYETLPCGVWHGTYAS